MIYELEESQKAVNFLADYYEVRRLQIILNCRKVGGGCIACYFDNKAYFTKKGLKKKTVLSARCAKVHNYEHNQKM